MNTTAFNLALVSLAAAGVAQPAAASTQEAALTGRWEGRISVAGQSIRIVLRIDETGQAVMDSPDQGAIGIPAEGPIVTGGVVRFSVGAIGGRFEGALSADGGSMAGTLTQGGVSVPLVLARTGGVEGAVLNRPQTPMPPFPYRAEEVAFDNPAAPGVRLAGTLTLPEGAGPFPAAILISGTGPQDRDETVFGHKPFAVWADALARRGVAVLRFDDRGVGRSTGDFAASTIADFAKDAGAALTWLAARPEIDADRIGFIGHSEGGVVVPLALENRGGAAWMVALAGPAASGADIIEQQARRMGLASGAPVEAVEAAEVNRARLMEIVLRHPDDGDAARRELEPELLARGLEPALAAQTAAQLSAPWYRWLVAHDPAASLGALTIPVLAVYGEQDLQVPADQNAPLMRRYRPDADVVVLPGLNHLFQPATTGLPVEYGQIETTLDPSVITLVVDWIAARTGL